MKPDNQDPGLGNECGTECGGTSAGSDASSIRETADDQPAPGNALASSTSSCHFADVAVGNCSQQKLKVSAESAVGAQIVALPEPNDEFSEKDKAEQGKIEQGKIEQGKIEQGKIEQGKIERDKIASGQSEEPVMSHMPHAGVQRWAPGFGSGFSGSNRFTTADSRARQLFNAMYFGLAAISCLSLSTAYSLHLSGWFAAVLPTIGMGLWGAFFALTLCACFFAINNRPHESDFKVDLMPHVRRRIRRIGLLLPLPVILLAGSVQLSHHEVTVAQHRLGEGKNHKAARHLSLAIALNPLNEQALTQMALCQNRLSQYQQAFEFAHRALQLNATDANALAHESWALNRLQRYKEALTAAEGAVRFDPSNGEGYSDLASAYAGLGNYYAALSSAVKHVQLHSSEASAYDQLGDVYERLGESEQASVVRDQAQALRSPEDEN